MDNVILDMPRQEPQVLSFRSPTAQVAQDLFNEHNQTEQAQRFLAPVEEQNLWYEHGTPHHSVTCITWRARSSPHWTVTRCWLIRGQVHPPE